MYYALIVISFFISMAITGSLYRKTTKKMISIFVALMINAVFLGAAFTVSYQMDIESWNVGMGDWKIAYLIIAIPLVTWLNAFLLQFMKVKETIK